MRLIWKFNLVVATVAFSLIAADFLLDRMELLGSNCSSDRIKGSRIDALFDGQPVIPDRIDVFPLDGAPDNPTGAEEQISKLKPLWISLFRCRALKGTPMREKKSLPQVLRLARIKFLKLFDGISLEDVRSEYIRICKEVPFGTTKHYSNYSYLGYGIKEYQSVSDYDSMITVPFEDSYFQCIGGYHQHMTNKYGNYMVPPKNKEQNGHGGYEFYWNNKG